MDSTPKQRLLPGTGRFPPLVEAVKVVGDYLQFLFLGEPQLPEAELQDFYCSCVGHQRSEKTKDMNKRKMS